jgi:hypothetical protein
MLTRIFQTSMRPVGNSSGKRTATTKQEGVLQVTLGHVEMSSTFPVLTLVLLLAVVILVRSGRPPKIAA